MREILFRGKRIFDGKWVNGFAYKQYSAAKVEEWYIRAFETDFLVIPETVCQFTGLIDKNGRKIFEGDIVVFADFFNDEIHRGVVYWCDLAFWFDCTETEGDEGIYSLAYISANILEVIGNIYDNPELMEVKPNEM